KLITFTGGGVKASGSISSVVRTTPENVLLTESGVTDWIHWKSADLTTFDAMNGSGNGLGTLHRIGSGEVKVITDESVRFSWANGSPTAPVAGSTDAIAV